jgi:SAM-dependent methyltransferase
MVRLLLFKLRRSFARRGLLGTLRHALQAGSRRLYELTPSAREDRRRQAEAERDFDRKHNVDTGGLIDLGQLRVDSGNWQSGNRYQGVNVRVFKELMTAAGLRHQDFVFVDLGSGKGRALLLASEYPFRKVVGVEFSADLVAIARKNIENYRSTTQACRDIEVCHGDATAFPLPPTPTVLFLYNPFDRPVMQKVAERARASWLEHRRDILVLYVVPEHGDLWTATGVFLPAGSTPAYAIYRTPAVAAQPGAPVPPTSPPAQR